MRERIVASFMALAWLSSACGGPSFAKPPEASEAPPAASSDDPSSRDGTRIEKLVARMQRVSSSAHMLKDKSVDASSLVFASAGEPRETLSFHFDAVPYKEGMPGGEDGFAALNAKLDVDGSRTVVIAMAFTGKSVDVDMKETAESAQARLESVRILVARDASGEPSSAARRAVAKLWGLGPDSTQAPYERAAFDAIVLGTRLQRHATPPSFSNLGKGTWTLLRLVEPAEAYLAVDWDAGVGEFFPGSASASGAGTALVKAL